MASTKVNKFDDCVYAHDIVKRLDFLGIYLPAPLQRDLKDHLEDMLSERYREGFSDGEQYMEHFDRGDDD